MRGATAGAVVVVVGGTVVVGAIVVVVGARVVVGACVVVVAGGRVVVVVGAGRVPIGPSNAQYSRPLASARHW